MRQSTLTAGIDPGVTGLAAISGDFDAPATIKKLTIKGIKNDSKSAFSASSIAAKTLGSIKLQTVASTTTTVPFGLAAQTFARLGFTKDGEKFTVTPASLPSLNLPADDFAIRIV
jgi:hypothetical protein